MIQKHLSFFLFLLFHITTAQSQSKAIKGVVFSTENRPVEDVLVSIINILDNTVVTTFSDSLGHYQVESFLSDSVYLEVGTLNSKKETRSIRLSPGENVIDTIYVEENQLAEVVITAGAYSVERETDKLRMNMNPQNNLIKNSNIWNIMRIVPTVSVSELDGISMIGKQNVSIFINGKKSMLSFTALKSYMESMPAENIRTVELIHNPGVTFNSGTNTGVINIILRKPDTEGVKGMASVTMWQTHYNKQIASLNLNYKKENISVISNISIRNLHDWNAFTVKRTFTDIQQEVEETGSNNNRRPIYIGNIDVSYELNKTNKIGAVVGVEYINFHPNSFTTASYRLTGSNVVDSVISSSSVSDNKQLRSVNNLNYTFTNDKSIFKFDIDFLSDQTKENYLFESISRRESRYKQSYPQDTEMWSLKTEYNYKKGIQGITIGMDSYITESENRNEYQDTINASKPLLDNKYIYKEKSIGGFLSYDVKWNDKFSSKIGLRFNYVNTNGELFLPERKSTVYSYKKLNPSLSLSYTPSENHNFWYNMSVRDNYYKFTYLNPVRIYQSADLYNVGNPDLCPSRTYSQDIGYNLKSMYMIFLGYNVTENAMAIFSLPKTNSVTESKPLNYGNENNIYLVSNINKFMLDKQLFLNVGLDGGYTYYKSKIPEIGTSGSVFNGGAKISGTFIPSNFNTWQFVSDMQYRSPFKTMTWHYSSSLRGSVEISKRIRHFSVSMYGFYSLQYSEGRFSTKLRSSYSVENYTFHSVSKGEYSGFMLSVVYRFGNNKVQNGPKRVVSTSSIQNRFKDNK